MLNGQLLTERRLALELRVGDIAKAIGVSQPVISRLEGGDVTLELNLRQLSRLADVLALTVPDLFAAKATTARPSPDDLKLDAAFALVNKKLSAVDIARAFDWSLPRAHA